MRKLLVLLAAIVCLAAPIASTASPTPPKPNQHYVLCGPGCSSGGPALPCNAFYNGAYAYAPYPYLFLCIYAASPTPHYQWIFVSG